jgi:hypothetical protein
MKISKEEFIEATKDRGVLEQFDNLEQYTDFEEIHGCEYAHGQYGTENDSRGKMLRMYLEDHYPNRKYKLVNQWISLSFVAIFK